MSKTQKQRFLPPEVALDIIREILETRPENPDKVEKLKRKVVGRYRLPFVPRNSELLSEIGSFPQHDREYLRKLLRVREIRTLSGIAVVAVMTRPSGCPGNCIYCPGGVTTPKSYTGKEPATMRGIQNNFDPWDQVTARIKQLDSIGHDPSKIHLVIQGGTFPAQDPQYQEFFIQNCLDAISGSRSLNLSESFLVAENSQRRCVGITVETRPDYCRPNHVDAILGLSGTWVEIGVQTLSNTVYKLIKRGHTVTDAAEALRVARDAGLKITVHMMPNLFQTPAEDKAMFDQLFEDPHFRPDAVKIYPTLVLEDTALFEMWERGDYSPYSEEKVIDVMVHMKSHLPPWVRIQRIQRDIPAYLIQDGVVHGNLREMVQKVLQERGLQCRCIRCREIGIKSRLGGKMPDLEDLKPFEENYEAGNGTEHFLSVESSDREFLYGFLRLRNPSSSAHRPEIRKTPSLIIRELHVYGSLVPLGLSPKNQDDQRFQAQHRGIGQHLLRRAEKIAENNDARQILVTSGIGVKEYYRNQGYKRIGPYMGKSLDKFRC